MDIVTKLRGARNWKFVQQNMFPGLRGQGVDKAAVEAKFVLRIDVQLVAAHCEPDEDDDTNDIDTTKERGDPIEKTVGNTLLHFFEQDISVDL